MSVQRRGCAHRARHGQFSAISALLAAACRTNIGRDRATATSAWPRSVRFVSLRRCAPQPAPRGCSHASGFLPHLSRPIGAARPRRLREPVHVSTEGTDRDRGEQVAHSPRERQWLVQLCSRWLFPHGLVLFLIGANKVPSAGPRALHLHRETIHAIPLRCRHAVVVPRSCIVAGAD